MTREEVKAAAVVGVRSQVTRIEERDIIDEVPVDVKVFGDDRLALQLLEVTVKVPDLRGRPVMRIESRWALVLGEKIGEANDAN
jgi:hypothetical protein